jgi:hypothetical protein
MTFVTLRTIHNVPSIGLVQTLGQMHMQQRVPRHSGRRSASGME